MSTSVLAARGVLSVAVLVAYHPLFIGHWEFIDNWDDGWWRRARLKTACPKPPQALTSPSPPNPKPRRRQLQGKPGRSRADVHTRVGHVHDHVCERVRAVVVL